MTQRRLQYNRIAGQSLERIAALSDGIFAVAMTLIVLDIRVPARELATTEGQLWLALLALGPNLVTYLLSFLTLGIFWTGQQTQLNFLASANRDLAWIHFGFLAVVATLPFSTRLLADFLTFKTALGLYWLNIACLGGFLYASWSCAERAGLVKVDAPPGLSSAIKRRILIAQALYAAASLLCFLSPVLSIVVIVAVQLHYAIVPLRAWRSAGRPED